MKIKKINNIRGYKSFIDFKWSEFCKDRIGNELPLNPFNVFYGENGCGKSSICQILKDLSQHTEFSSAVAKPNYVEIKVDNVLHKFQADAWDSRLPINSLLFFDQSFIDENVHTNGERSNERNRHSQNSGKLLVELDAQATLKKEDEDNKKKLFEEYELLNDEKLKQIFSPEDHALFSELKDYDQGRIDEYIIANNRQHDIEKLAIEDLNKRVTQTDSVSAITLPNKIRLLTKIPHLDVFHRVV